MIVAMSAETGYKLPETEPVRTSDEVYAACEEAIAVPDPKERIETLQKLMAETVEQELQEPIERVYQCLHEDYDQIGMNYYETYTQQEWRGAAYNGMIAVLVGARDLRAASKVIEDHNSCIDELSDEARAQTFYTVVANYIQTTPWQEATATELSQIKRLFSIGLHFPPDPIQARAELYAASTRQAERFGWPQTPLDFMDELEKTKKTSPFSDEDQKICSDMERSMITTDKDLLLTARVWTPANAAAAMRSMQ